MSQYNVVRFDTTKKNVYSTDIQTLMSQGPITDDSAPYIGIVDMESKSLVSCIWKDANDEICMITEKEYRNKGLMRRLLVEVVSDVFRGEIEEVSAMPINTISRNCLKQAGFQKEDESSYSFSLS